MEDLSSDGKLPRGITQSQRALELRKFFAPSLSHHSNHVEDTLNENLNDDGALSAYAETIIWRLRGVHCMVSLIDRTEQYFIAGATQVQASDGDEEIEESSKWFGCDTVPTPGGLCENTLALDGSTDPYPCFVINDLSRDERFASLPVVNGAVASYRFYAGTPITTRHGVNIGSFFIFDDKPRAGLTLNQKKCLHATAAKVMRHLETKKKVAERHRVVMMSQGISKFLETAEPVSTEPAVTEKHDTSDEQLDAPVNAPIDTQMTASIGTTVAVQSSERGIDTVLDKVRATLDHAAEVLRDSLELTAGGVVFLDTAISYSDVEDTRGYSAGISLNEGESFGAIADAVTGPFVTRPGDRDGWNPSSQSVRPSDDQRKSTRVLAMSTAPIATWDHKTRFLNRKTLEKLITSYPKGNIWYIDDEGYFSSLDQIRELARSATTSRSGRVRSVSPIDAKKQNSEATMLSHVFHRARQIMFLPVWDAAGGRWYSGCFVWSRSAVPVWTVGSEIAHLSAFTNSLMIELSRLDAVTSNKMKSDFISSISHEFRSPLHGILASAEFLRDSDLDASQIEFISTIQNCSGTLLDTINHVLDYSKINSFENVNQGSISNELYQVTNLALLCEDLINGMIAAGEFRGAGPADPSIPVSDDSARRASHHQAQNAVEVILDIEHTDWLYKIQAGAVRRVIMNIFGNAQKYTTSGYILVEVRIRKSAPDEPNSSTGIPREVLFIHIRDTGRGMSPEYMERKLYHPFAQEDSFASGVGLGLSIVWSIVNQLGGKIQIRSELGKGTDVEITLPVNRPDKSDVSSRPDDLSKLSANAQEAITSLRERAAGKIVLVARPTQNVISRYRNASWNCIERYCSEWFGFHVITTQDNEKITDLVITAHVADRADSESSDGQRNLVVHDHIGSHQHKKIQLPVGAICTPIGPFKLARSIISLLEQEIPSRASKPSNTLDRGTQTPLASPEDPRQSNGQPMTDYGFTVPLTSPLTTIPNSIEAPIPQNSVVVSSHVSHTQDDGTKQAIASLGALSLRLPSRFPKGTQTPSSAPAIPKEQAPNSVIPGPPPNITNALHILAVDDNVINLKLIHRYLLQRKIHTILTARNGIEAVAAVREEANQGKNFDVIFMDISMPEMDGFEATRLIRSFERSLMHRSISEENSIGSAADGVEETVNGMTRTPLMAGRSGRLHAHVVALTGLASRRDRDEAETSGFDDFLTKPISFGKIGELLDRLSKEKAGFAEQR